MYLRIEYLTRRIYFLTIYTIRKKLNRLASPIVPKLELTNHSFNFSIFCFFALSISHLLACLFPLFPDKNGTFVLLFSGQFSNLHINHFQHDTRQRYF